MKTDLAASVRWFGAEQAATWALQAFYAACRDIEPPAGEAVNDPEFGPWAHKGDFAHAFHAAFTRRLSLAAFRRGDVPSPSSATEPLGWPDQLDSDAQSEFLERLKIGGLLVEQNAGNNRPSPGSR